MGAYGVYRQLDEAWDTRRANWPHRNLRSYSFSKKGKGSTYLRLRKFGENFAVGYPKFRVPEDRRGDVPAPVHEEGAPYYCELNIQGAKNEYEILAHFTPVEQFQTVLFVSTPDALYMPASYDQTRNNLLQGMQHSHLAMANSSNPHLRDYPNSMMLYWNDTMHFDNVIYYADGSLSPGVKYPKVTVLDKEVYTRGRQRLKEALKLLDVYCNRHQILQQNRYDSWHYGICHYWTPDNVWTLANHEITAPEDFRILFSPYDTNYRKGIPIPSMAQLRRLWVMEGFKRGFVSVDNNKIPRVEVDYEALLAAS